MEAGRGRECDRAVGLEGEGTAGEGDRLLLTRKGRVEVDRAGDWSVLVAVCDGTRRRGVGRNLSELDGCAQVVGDRSKPVEPTLVLQRYGGVGEGGAC